MGALFFGYQRYGQNQESIIPYPFTFSHRLNKELEITAPIIIIGDTMAERLSLFKKRLAEKISKNLSKPIEIQSLALNGENIHRTLQKLKNLNKVPLITIYLGQMDQNYEYIFSSRYLDKINKNFSYLKDPRIHTALMIFPFLSRLLYHPIKYVQLNETLAKDQNNYDDTEYQKRQSVSFTLYQYGLEELFQYFKKRNSLIIPITTPINLSMPPNKSCYGSFTGNAKDELKKINEIANKEDYKLAYNLAKELALINPYNSKINYTYAQILKKLNYYKEAQEYGELARVYDCSNNGANPVYNAILKKQASKFGYQYLDFHQLLVDESTSNHVFLDETYPQDFYFEKIIDALARKIKLRLKL